MKRSDLFQRFLAVLNSLTDPDQKTCRERDLQPAGVPDHFKAHRRDFPGTVPVRADAFGRRRRLQHETHSGVVRAEFSEFIKREDTRIRMRENAETDRGL